MIHVWRDALRFAKVSKAEERNWIEKEDGRENGEEKGHCS